MRILQLPLILGLIMTTMQARGDDTLGTGASVLWTSADPLIASARDLVERGELRKAEAVLAQAKADEALETIARIRYDYALDESQILEKLRRAVRDVSIGDLRAWTQSSQIQFREIDGQTRYFRREPANLFRFCPDAISRRIQPPTKSGGFKLQEHLSQIVAESGGESPYVAPVRHRIKFAITVLPKVRGYHAGANIQAWLPYPQEYGQRQTDVQLISTSGSKPQIAANGSIHRTLYFQQRIEDPTKPTRFEAIYEFTSRAEHRQLDDSKVQPLPADFPKHYLAERPPHIRFSPELKDLVARIVGDESNPLAKARKLFHWIDAKIRYHAEDEYCIIPSFCEAALKRRRGDCGIQATLFITMCRAAGVPARWQSGWQTKPSGTHDMHDWAEIYIPPWGWLPCDPSYGLQKSDNPAVREFYIGHQDSYRMIVNLDYGGPLTPLKQSLRSEPADFQRGEVELDGRNLYFDEFDYDFEVTHPRQ
jgi:hypothetical protein